MLYALRTIRTGCMKARTDPARDKHPSSSQSSQSLHRDGSMVASFVQSNVYVRARARVCLCVLLATSARLNMISQSESASFLPSFAIHPPFSPLRSLLGYTNTHEHRPHSAPLLPSCSAKAHPLSPSFPSPISLPPIPPVPLS